MAGKTDGPEDGETAGPIVRAQDPTLLAVSEEAAVLPGGAEVLPVVNTGNYTRRGEIARGGLGRIIEAHDQRLRRVVALKELRRRSHDAASRFVREAMVTARLQHPGIIPIYEAGRWPDGEPFYAMRLVSGTSLAEAIAARPTLDERLSLIARVIAVVDTIAYAHSQRVIHRDLKPHNVMCGDFGETVVIDWGLAKDLDAADSDAVATHPAHGPSHRSGSGSSGGATVAGTVMGTPAYMPPEQARGEPVDERADVYALGAVLYHVLAGAPPYRSEGETPVLAGPPPPLEQRVDGVPRDLVAIVARAMAREPADRYPTARELAEDLRRFQTGRLVSVREYTAAERLARWLRRYRAIVAVAALALVSILVIGTVAVIRVVGERDRANREAEDADRARGLALDRGDDLLLLQARGQLDRDPTATLAWLGQVSSARLDVGAADIAGDAVGRGVAVHVLRLEEGRIHGVMVGADGGGWALGKRGQLFAIDVATGAVREAYAAGENAVTSAVGGGGRVVAISSAEHVHVLRDGVPEVLPKAPPAISLAIDPAGERLALGQVDGALYVRALRAGTSTRLDQFGAEPREVAFSPDGGLLAAVGFDGAVAVYRMPGGERVLRGDHAGSVWGVAWAPDGSFVATACDDGTAAIWPIDGTPARHLRGHTGAVLDVAVGAGGRVATASRDGAVRLWSPAGAELAVLAHDDDVLRVVAAPDGGWASAGTDRTVRIWDADGAPIAALRGHEDFVSTLAFGVDGARLLSAGQDGSVRIWSTARDHEVLARDVAIARFDPRGEPIVAVRDGRVRAGESDLGAAGAVQALFLGDHGGVLGVAPGGAVVRFADTGASALTAAGAELGGVAELDGVVFGAGYDGKVWRWSDAAAAPVALPGHDSYVLTVVRIPGTDRVATGGADGTVRVWDRDGRVVHVLRDSEGPIHRVAASPDGALLAAGDGYGTVVVWRVSDGVELVRYRHGGMIQGLAFAPAGGLLASGGDDTLVRTWSAAGGERTFTGADTTVASVAIAPDGTRVAAGVFDGTVHVWDLSTGARRVLRGHRAAARAIQFTPDGGLLSWGDDGTLRRWPVASLAPPPAGSAALRRWIAGWTDAAIDASERPTTPRR